MKRDGDDGDGGGVSVNASFVFYKSRLGLFFK